MIGYVTLGTRDLARGAKFYDAIAKELGVGRMGGSDRFIAWGTPGGAAGVGLALPYDGKPATVGNGVMVAFEAKDKEQVDRIYKLACPWVGPTKVHRGSGSKVSTRPISATSMATNSTPT